MLSRDQVLHVARLARLELTEEEIERYRRELSKVLDWIEKIGELGDLADVEPTSHVVAVENVLRADEPRPSLPREVALAQRARPGARRLPRAEPGGRDERAARPDRGRRRPSASTPATSTRGELWRFYRDRAPADDLNAFTWVCEDDEPPAIDRERPARRRADRRQGPVLHRGHPVARPARRSSRATARRTPPPRSSGS